MATENVGLVDRREEKTSGIRKTNLRRSGVQQHRRNCKKTNSLNQALRATAVTYHESDTNPVMEDRVRLDPEKRVCRW